MQKLKYFSHGTFVEESFLIFEVCSNTIVIVRVDSIHLKINSLFMNYNNYNVFYILERKKYLYIIYEI